MTKLGLRWRPSARTEFNQIIRYIAQANTVAAREMRVRVLGAVEQARLLPQLYRPGRVEGTRAIVVHPSYIVVYRVEPDCVRVVSVFHTRQEYPPSP